MNNKKTDRIAAIAIAISVLACIVFLLLPKETAESAAYSFEYPEKLFGADIIEINIRVDDDKWQTMLDNAISETYIPCDITVNGTAFQTVGVRPKGNSSLSMTAGSGSDRYSFKVQFDEYIDGQTCFGLDKLVLNNMQADYTYMKEYFSYYLMNYMGVDSPFVNYAHITVNGKEWGLYLAVECYEESFVERVYGISDGNLYSVKMAMGRGKEEPGAIRLPDGMNGGAAAGAGGEIRENTAPGKADGAAAQGGPGYMPGDAAMQGKAGAFMQGGNIGGLGRSGGGGNLIYTDDNSSSYSSIFGNAVFNKSDEEDYQRIIKALKKLSMGEELEKYFDIDQILRYFAVHTTVVNLDSYISNMQQNYYLYERDGKVTILPWDYNLSFGGFQSGDAGSVVNFAIDTPVSGVELSERPLIAKLLEVPEYKEKYHEYLQKIADYLNGGQFANQVQTVDSLISGYVEKDATAFCTYEQYKSAVETFKQLCLLRAESIRGQLDGTIPSTASGQSGSSALINADSINLSTMGSQGGGKGNMGDKFGRSNMGGMGGKPNNTTDNNVAGNSTGGGQVQAKAPDMGNGRTEFPQREFGRGAMQNPPAILYGFNNKDIQMNFQTTQHAVNNLNKQGILWIGISFAALIIGICTAAVYKRR